VIAMTSLFTLAEDTDWEAMRETARQRIDLYRDMPGLRAKAFVIDTATRRYGGIYIWETRAAMEDFLRSDVQAGARQRFGEPHVEVFEVPAYLEGAEVIT
jgi:heme-degrading monooxygenase HmoA